MSGKRPKGTFQDRYNKPDSAIPPDSEEGTLKGLYEITITLIISQIPLSVKNL